MGLGALTLAMSLLLGQPAEDIPFTNQRALRVPFNVDATRRAELRELLLFASWDQGQTYQQVAAMLPEKNEFAFEARNDGVCWLQGAVVTRQGKQEPENILQRAPDQKIIIDTVKPVVRAFTAQHQGDDIVASWEILEDHFDPKGFHLEYQGKGNASSFWTKVPATPGLTGQQRFRASAPGALVLRLTATDLAGNTSSGITEIQADIKTVSFVPQGTAPSNNVAPPILPPPALPASTLTSVQLPPPVQPEPVKQQPTPPATWSPAPGATAEIQERPVATSQSPPLPAPVPPAPVARAQAPSAPAPAPRPLPALKYVNHPKVMLDYELAKVGNSGVGSIDLWWTQNDGQSWELYAIAPDVDRSTQNGRHQREVELPGEGTYGFILLVKSRAGLGKAPPHAGDVPHIRVEVDTTPPVAKLWAPIPDPQRPGSLVLRYEAKDKNLANTPITLEWAESPAGEWKAIATDIKNDREFSWQPPATIPVQVYMRLRARDLAGNETVAITQDAQWVDLSEPEGRLIDVTVTPRKP